MLRLLLAGLAAAVAATPAVAAYKFTTLDDPNALPGQTFAYGINDAGQVTGWFNDAVGSHGFVYDGVTWKTLDNPAANPGATLAFVMNDSGQLLGNFFDAAGGHYAIFDGTTWKTLGEDPDAANNSTIYTGLNDAGVLSGAFHDSFGIYHAFLYDGTTYTTLDYPQQSVSRTVAWGLNDAGAIAGYYLGPLPTPMGNYFAQHGFVFDGTNWSGFDAPDATGLTFAQAINDAGLVAGYYLDAAGDHGFVYDGTSVSEFDEPDASAGSTQVWGVNDAGTLVGRFSDANGAHGFLATLANAAPEPPEWLLVIAAFAALACFRSCTRATRHTAPGLFA